MIPYAEICMILAAACLIPSLYRGAVQDLKEFKFAEIHFDSLWVNVAIVLVIASYVSLVIDGVWLLAGELLFLSLAASLLFSFIGFRYGRGGDWRALCFVSWIAPFMLLQVLVASALCAFVQGIYWMARTDIDTPPMFRQIPFAVSILCGYVIALVWMVLDLGGVV
jgi:uncharacterized membrane protein